MLKLLETKVEIDIMVRLIIPEGLDKKYNYALKELPKGQNTLVGNRDKKKC